MLPNKCYQKCYQIKLHSILAVANLLAHNNRSQICYCSQISLQSAAVNCSFTKSDTSGGNIYFAGDGISAQDSYKKERKNQQSRAKKKKTVACMKKN